MELTLIRDDFASRDAWESFCAAALLDDDHSGDDISSITAVRIYTRRVDGHEKSLHVVPHIANIDGRTVKL